MINDRLTPTSLTIRGEVRCSGRISSSFSIGDNGRVTLVTDSVTNEERPGSDKWNISVVICDTDVP